MPSDMTNSARFLPFNFTHNPSYQKGKTVSGTTKRREVALAKLLYWPAQAWEVTSKLTNTVKSLINGHIFPRITIRQLPVKLIYIYICMYIYLYTYIYI